jgi:hypothetical protein
VEKRRFTKVEIIDAIVAEATKGLFTGDKRDGEAAPITRQNFHSEKFRYGARALRARLSRLSPAELLREYFEGTKFDTALQEYKQREIALMEHKDREDAAQANSQRQSQHARRPRLQRAILAAARHYRALGMYAKQAWSAIKQKPYEIDGETVLIVGSKGKETMCVQSPDGTQKRSGIKDAQWQKSYWRSAK